MILPSSNLDLENNIFSTLSLVYNKMINGTTGLGSNIAQLVSYTTGNGTITLPDNFTHLLILMGGWGGWGGGSDGSGYGAWGWAGGAFILALRTKSQLTGNSLSYSIGSGGVGWGSGQPGSNGGNTTLTGSGVDLTASGGHGGHRGTSSRWGNDGLGVAPVIQYTNDIGITGANGGSYASGYPTQTTFTFFGLGKGGINGPESGAGSYDGVAGSPGYYYNNYLSSTDGSCSGGGGVGGYHSGTGGLGASGFLRIYYFYN